MEIAFGMLGVGLTLLGILLAYIWKSNGELQAKMMAALERMMTAHEQMMAALERIEMGQEKGVMGALERIEVGQEKGLKILAEMLMKQTEMLINQTKILERIEGKL